MALLQRQGRAGTFGAETVAGVNPNFVLCAADFIAEPARRLMRLLQGIVVGQNVITTAFKAIVLICLSSIILLL